MPKIINFKKTNISYTNIGQGQAIVFLHGFLENKDMWGFFVQNLLLNYQIISIDLLGHGGTNSLGYIHTMDDNAAMVRQVLRELAIEKAILVGHSMGGYIALALSERYPKMITKLALINSTAVADSTEKKKNRERAIVAVKKDYKMFVNLSIGNLFSENNRVRCAIQIQETKNQALLTPLQGIIASLEGMKIRPDRQLILQKATYPILLVLGKKDPVLDFNETLKQTINTHVQTQILEDGHMSHIENKEELLEILLEFVS